jgi:hypothetical protein
MTIAISDIKYLYSGGVSNTNQNLSLGGSPSIYQVTNNLLFDNVTALQSSAGATDYRCIYITNDNATDSLYNATIYISYETPGTVNVQLGFLTQDDRQYVNISNFATITGGTITLTYTDTSSHNFTFSYNSDISVFSSNFQTAITAIGGLEDVTVAGSASLGSVVFEINFLGGSANRYHETLSENANNLTYTGSAPVVSIVKSVDGSPINREAESIDFETITPTSVLFSDSPYIIEELKGLDIIPVWVKRVVSANTVAVENDGFTLKIKGNAVLM